MTIELRLTDVDPPTEEPHRTIYHDIASLPDPVIQGITIRYFNHDDVDLYFKITGSGTGYTFTPVNLGLLATGTNAYKNLDNFASRAKPTSETSENITLTLTAYTDSGYTNLKWTFERVVQVIWINSADPLYTLDESDNFDDGTVQGWASNSIYGTPSQGVSTQYVLSTPYAFYAKNTFTAGSGAAWWEAYKEFTTPNKDTVYAIIDMRVTPFADEGPYGQGLTYIEVLRDSTLIIHLGKSAETSTRYDDVPRNRWIRIVVPLPKSVTLTLKIRAYVNYYSNNSCSITLDDFKIISK
jgi:hypothetical protein